MEPTPLLEVMTQEIDRDCDAIRASARQDAERIQEEARQTADRRRAESLDALEAELARLADQARQRAEAEAHMVVLTTKDTIVDEILEEAAGELAGIAKGPGFPEVLAALLEEVMADAPPNVRVLAPPAHESACRSWLDAHGHGEVPLLPSPELRDGVAIQDETPTFRITNTLSARLAKRTDALRKHCLELLFPDAPGAASPGDA